MSFTVIGDTVNTASRLQDLTRTLDTPLVAAEALVSAAGATVDEATAALLHRLQPRGEQQLRGRTAAVGVWVRVEPG
jgi:adenylate cyclase